MDITAKTKKTLLHQIIKRLEQLAPDRFKTDDENLEAIVHSPLESLKFFAVYTYKETRSWFALQATVLALLMLDGAMVEMKGTPCTDWYVKIVAPLDSKGHTDRISIHNKDLTIALCEAYEQYLSLRSRAEGKSEISNALEIPDRIPNKE